MRSGIFWVVAALSGAGCSDSGQDQAALNGLFSCQQALRSTIGLAEYPPYAKPWTADAERDYFYSWPSGRISPRVAASCQVDKVSGQIRVLTVNGRTVIER